MVEMFSRIIIVLTVVSCSGTPTEMVRSATYGPSFSYLSRSQIKTEMHRFAVGISELDRALAKEHPIDKQEVVRILEEIDRAAGHLENTGETTGHVEIDRELARFRRDIGAARDAADQERPSYFLATGIVSSCVYCHR
jgi:hypothetical protein